MRNSANDLLVIEIKEVEKELDFLVKTQIKGEKITFLRKKLTKLKEREGGK